MASNVGINQKEEEKQFHFKSHCHKTGEKQFQCDFFRLRVRFFFVRFFVGCTENNPFENNKMQITHLFVISTKENHDEEEEEHRVACKKNNIKSLLKYKLQRKSIFFLDFLYSYYRLLSVFSGIFFLNFIFLDYPPEPYCRNVAMMWTLIIIIRARIQLCSVPFCGSGSVMF